MSEHHAKYSPSKLSRIIACPASYKLSENIPNTTNGAAEEGTMLHAAVEGLLQMDDTIFTGLDDEQTAAVDQCVEYYDKLCSRLEGPREVFFEKQVSLAPIGIDNVYGTADVVIIQKDEIHIIDWKFGRGVYVSAQNNVQLKTYGLGAALINAVEGIVAGTFKEDLKIVTHVVQPRLNNFDFQEHTLGELSLWSENIIVPALESVESENPECHPGDAQCQWCPAKGNCRERFLLAREAATNIFAQYAESTATTNVTDEEKAELLGQAKLLKKYIAEIEKEAYEKLTNGYTFPGFKMVKGRNSRHWKNEGEATSFLINNGFKREEIYTHKFLTPPQAEKLAKAFKKDEGFAELIKTVPGKPTIAPESDPREACASRAQEVFKEYSK